MKTKYVLGFLFDESLNEVVLIRKNRPKWQAGFLNGVGGKVEELETSNGAMTREFYEETGCVVYNWIPVGKMEGTEFIVHVFKRSIPDLSNIQTTTDEEVVKVRLDEIHLRKNEMISNIPWLIYVCLDTTNKYFKVEY